MRFDRNIFIGTLFLLATSSAFAAGEKASRAATKEDMLGTWELVSIQPLMDKTDPVFFPYQRFVFRPDSSLKIMTADKPFTKEWEDQFEKAPPAVDYTVNEKGLLTLTWQARPYSETAVAAFILKDVPPEVQAKIPKAKRRDLPQKGNLTLSFLKDGKIVYQKILKKTG